MKLDVHANLYLKSFPDDVRRFYENDTSAAVRGVTRVLQWATNEPKMWSEKQRLSDMERKHPGRFHVFASVPLLYPDEAVQELD